MIRLFVESDLAAGAAVDPRPNQARYLTTVMRLKTGDRLRLFNGRDGEWEARVAAGREVRLLVETRTQAQTATPDLELLVALIKRPRLETVVEKAAELGVRRVRLVVTERSQPGGARLDRLAAIATEAAEQTGRLDVPSIERPEPLDDALAALGQRKLLFCDEAGDALPVLDALGEATPGPWAILIGPEGGFSPAERARVRASPGALAVTLGPRILRADTAAIAAMTLWQASLGDWTATGSTPPISDKARQTIA
ncbi:MAG: 16S rRNA (uracil(1498)-N(3))-methyltransferase [Caulobacteraceae bacterium]